MATVTAVGASTGALLAGLLTPVAAAGSEPGRITTSNDHAMGAAIRAHDSGAAARHHPAGQKQARMAKHQTPGMDVSHYQGDIDWQAAAAKGARFAYIKATEGTGYRDPNFQANYSGAHDAGLIRGAYHYGRPDVSGGAAQADYFVANGGGWTGDGRTLPGTLDIEYGAPSQGGTCYGYTKDRMAAWIKAFSDEYHRRTGRWPVIYTSTNWWSQCVGTAGKFADNSPLWIARYSDSVGALPYNWAYHSIWQYADSGKFPGDQDRFNGDYSQLQAIAQG